MEIAIFGVGYKLLIIIDDRITSDKLAEFIYISSNIMLLTCSDFYYRNR